MTDKELCQKCNHQCCRSIGFTTSKMSDKAIEFYSKRGCKVLMAGIEGKTIYRVYIPQACPHLVEGDGCGIYETRPQVCREYRGIDDPLVQDVCQIKEG
jgi:uncharacterized protein